MTDPTNKDDQPSRASLAEFTTEIVSAYVTNTTVAMNDLGELIGLVGRQLRALGQKPAEPAPAKLEPAVSIRRSVQQDHLVCLVCGSKQKILRRHLMAAHGLTPEAYRQAFGLKPDYPMAAPSSQRMRSNLAKELGLGRRTQPTPPPRRKGRERSRG